jgi:hypothetical protein
VAQRIDCKMNDRTGRCANWRCRRPAATESVRLQCEAGGSNAAHDVEPTQSRGACEDDRMNGGDNNDKTMEIEARMNTTGAAGSEGPHCYVKHSFITIISSVRSREMR